MRRTALEPSSIHARIGARAILGSAFLVSALLVPAVGAVGPGIETTGPDVTINLLDTLATYTNEGGFAGYSVGTTSCNIGTQSVNWCDEGGCPNGLDPSQHPVIAQGLYRLEGGRFEQISQSWLKHGFFATNSTEGSCKVADGCHSAGTGALLGVGCRDTYWDTLNGSRPMGRRSEVDATTGDFPFPGSGGGTTTLQADQRLKTAVADVDPSQNAGASYWVEGQYVADNDALAGNGLNNASYRPVTFAQDANFTASLTGAITRERSAIHAWQGADAAVQMANVDVPGAVVQRFEVARKVTNPSPGTWHYEFAIRNFNSDRSAGSFTVDFADGTAITNVGFHDVPSHSGEPYSNTDWTPTTTQSTGTVSWAGQTFDVNANANALRWGTMYSFRFDADVGPGSELYTLGLFKPGTPTEKSWTWPLFADGFEAHNFAVWSALTP